MAVLPQAKAQGDGTDLAMTAARANRLREWIAGQYFGARASGDSTVACLDLRLLEANALVRRLDHLSSSTLSTAHATALARTSGLRIDAIRQATLVCTGGLETGQTEVTVIVPPDAPREDLGRRPLVRRYSSNNRL